MALNDSVARLRELDFCPARFPVAVATRYMLAARLRGLELELIL
ncbi:MAG TPA: hypothetical protein VK892_05100 [Pyrinomonadaceae bacterium]|nr:hypothetical protein [Pyrinomonadaceae bacterium]